MRKMKKISGYLVVRFNDREKRLNDGTGLGSFGVIDAEQYTGVLDIDRAVMEYDSADTLEEAIEQARGLESELEVTEPEVKITIVIETDTDTTEEEVDPFALFQRESSLIHNQAASPNWPYIDEYTAPYHLRGYVSALEDLNLIDLGDERFQVETEDRGDHAPMLTPKEVEDFRQLKSLLEEVEHYATAKESTPPRMLPPSQDKHADRKKTNREKRFETGFLNPPERCKVPSIKLYKLGERLLDSCPEDDCIIYRNIFRVCYEADIQLCFLMGWTRTLVEREFNKQYRELERMYLTNHAVKKYLHEHPLDSAYHNPEEVSSHDEE